MSSRTQKKSSSGKQQQRQMQAPGQPAAAAARQQTQLADEEKRQARMQRQAEARAAAQRRMRAAKMRRYAIIAGISLVILGAIAWFMWQEANKPGQSVAQVPSQHIQSVDVPHSYNNDPPTSGAHLSGLAPWGVSTVPITKELQLHNLEDGGVSISYRPDLDKATVDKLAELVRSYPTKVLLAPYPGLSNSIVMTAWNRVDRLDVFDEARIRRFVDTFRDIDHHRESGT